MEKKKKMKSHVLTLSINKKTHFPVIAILFGFYNMLIIVENIVIGSWAEFGKIASIRAEKDLSMTKCFPYTQRRNIEIIAMTKCCPNYLTRKAKGFLFFSITKYERYLCD